ncbi:HNH endonuclease [Salinicoccus roseus]|uniref:HNH endonuclease n=1 Tax=Salinicoccus roseus TaxID=45670 RepID=UPI0023006A59|nr:HNH endonuclease [Salinicoccus roseus]
MSSIENLKMNAIYTDKDIFDIFQCSKFKGIRVSNKNKAIVLILKHVGILEYQDQWDGDILYYTGSGSGNQKVERENRTLADSRQNGYRIYLFEVFKEKEYTYSGIFSLIDSPFFVEENGRQVLKFPIQKVDQNERLDEEFLIELEESIEKKVDGKRETKVKEKALEYSERNKNLITQAKQMHRKVSRTWYDRNLYVVKTVKVLAEGVCQLCEKEAPFKDKRGNPYLHVHHIEYLSEGGKDVIENCIALCPNCHAEVHEFDDMEVRNKLKKRARVLYEQLIEKIESGS